eukprot:TRINITY_DN26033_c0_g1_i1.p1 TRINITY_DN26033_c0_g1~~TRINITY_DN26033_c0_g1_i1.p1  ORF type:complete len:379 (+),score=85.67 TRINITY_DN26033_c0_g1_i1:54-1190(+)
MLIHFQCAGLDSFSIAVKETATVDSVKATVSENTGLSADNIDLCADDDGKAITDVQALQDGCTVVVKASARALAVQTLTDRGCELSTDAVSSLLKLGEWVTEQGDCHPDCAELLPLYLDAGFAGPEALFVAAATDDAASMQRVLDTGVGINTNDDTFYIPALLFAAACGSVACLRLALAAGSSLDERVGAQTFSGGLTALMLAARCGSAECVRLLLDAGCDVNVRADYGDSALSLALFGESIECVRMILDAGCDVASLAYKALAMAASKGSVECLRLLVDMGCDINATCNYAGNMTTLMHAACSGSVEAMRFVIEAGCDIDAKCKKGKTAMHHAKKCGNHALLQQALDESNSKKRRRRGSASATKETVPAKCGCPCCR